ncbi:MAG: hypothetical protein ACE5R6_01515 [Candidatus Heimdallarchaeota archaeon]
MQFCALCGKIIESESNLLTLYFEIDGMGAFELNIHTEDLTKLGDPDLVKNNGTICVFCGLQNPNSCILVRQLDNLSYPVHNKCLEHMLEQLAERFSFKYELGGFGDSLRDKDEKKTTQESELEFRN